MDVDHDKAYALGLTPAQVSDALYSAYGTRQISTIYSPNNEYYVIVELLPEFQNLPDKLSLSVRPLQCGQVDSARYGRETGSLRWPAHSESPGTVAGRHHQLQP